MPESDVTAVIQRSDVISYGTLAEMNHFQRERVTDYKEMMQKYLSGQIKFYREVRARLKSISVYIVLSQVYICTVVPKEHRPGQYKVMLLCRLV